MQALADAAITEDGSHLRDAMKDFAVDLATTQLEAHAPVEFDDLRKSGHATVLDNGAVIYDRPPEVARLSEEELKAKSRARSDLGLRVGHREHIPRDVQRAVKRDRANRRKELGL